MDPSQERDPGRWFDSHAWDHADFPSGRALGTAVVNGACVFLGADRRCVLQKASSRETGNLKPFFCATFPLAICEGTLCFDEGEDAKCCMPSPDGRISLFELCARELETILGVNGVTELRDRARSEVK